MSATVSFAKFPYQSPLSSAIHFSPFLHWRIGVNSDEISLLIIFFLLITSLLDTALIMLENYLLVTTQSERVTKGEYLGRERHSGNFLHRKIFHWVVWTKEMGDGRKDFKIFLSSIIFPSPVPSLQRRVLPKVEPRGSRQVLSNLFSVCELQFEPVV